MERVSIILSRIAYFIYICKFEIKRLLRKKIQVSMTKDEAISILSSVYDKPQNIEEPIRCNFQSCDDNMDLSIIVPVYNYVNLIRENIESILKQKTKYSYELILIDDGSTDGSREILMEYQDQPKVKLVLQNNQGIAGARNSGLNVATGKYIMFIDCDDTIHDDMVEVLMNRAFQEKCDIVMCAHNLVKERSGEVYQVIPNVYPGKNLQGYNGNAEILNYAGLPWCKVYKRDLWKHVRFLRGYWYEDTIIQWLIFPQSKKFAYVPKVEYEYRWYENNFSQVQGKKNNIKSIDRYWMLLDIIERYNELKLPNDEVFYILLLKHLSAYYYRSLTGLDEKIVEAMFVLAREVFIQYQIENSFKLPYMLRVTEKALLRGDINLWKLASCYQ